MRDANSYGSEQKHSQLLWRGNYEMEQDHATGVIRGTFQDKGVVQGPENKWYEEEFVYFEGTSILKILLF